MNAIQTSHNLDFESREWRPSEPVANAYFRTHLNPNNIQQFRVGTVTGQWFYHPKYGLCILSIVNDSPNNGHLEDVFQWFSYSAKRFKKPLLILELMTERFKKHCIEKRGFIPMPGTDHLIKIF